VQVPRGRGGPRGAHRRYGCSGSVPVSDLSAAAWASAAISRAVSFPLTSL